MACKPDSVQGLPLWMTIPLPDASPRRSSCQPGPSRAEVSLRRSPAGLRLWSGPFRARPLFGIAPGGACRAVPVARSAVGSYPTVSPSPCPRRRRTFFASSRQTLLCGAFPGVAPAGHYPAPLLHGVRTFLEPVARPAVIQPSARRRDYAPEAGASTGKRVARSSAAPASWAERGPRAQGRKRRRKAVRSVFGAACG